MQRRGITSSIATAQEPPIPLKKFEKHEKKRKKRLAIKKKNNSTIKPTTMQRSM
jgi:hypothetical protein